MANNRTVRIAQEMKRELAHIISQEVKDDRLSPMANVSRIELTGDLKYAKVYISVYDEQKRRLSSVAALNHAARFIRSKLAHAMTVRTVPSLTFELDSTIEYSFEIEKKLQEVFKKDHETNC